jgi:energy-coupling factor transporter ATP-binding protein EcfA2
MSINEERVTYFGETDARNKKVKFGIKAKDRTKHVYVIGKTGMGKSTLLENMAVQDIQNGEGMAFIDPHGKTAELLLEYVPEHRMKDIVYFAPFDMEYPISFNVLESVDPDKRHLVVSGLMSTFKKIWKDAWSARMEYILTNTLLALLECPDATLLGVNRMLSDKEYRKYVISYVTDASVKAFWVQEFANYTERMAAEAVPAIQNKIGQFTANALIRNMIGQPKSSFDIRKMMDSGKIFIINLSKGRIGESNANLLGGMIITKIYLAALSRADVPDRVLKTLPNFYLFVDEFQSFANESFADILSEARKYKLNLTIAHQYIEQMEEEVRDAVFGNVGTMIVFRVGAFDAEVLEKEFSPQFTAPDIVNLGIFQIYLKLMIDGISSQPFSATTLPPIAKPESSSMTNVIAESRRQFANNRAEVEKKIDEWLAPMKAPVKDKVPAPQNPTSPPRPMTPIPRPVVAPIPPSPTPIVPPVVQQFQTQQPQMQPQTPRQNTQNTPPTPPIPLVPKMKSVPLSTLAQQPKQNNNNNQKDAIPQRVNELKNALANALSHGTVKQPQVMPSNTPVHVATTINEKNNKESTKEIPEDVLRNVLKVD